MAQETHSNNDTNMEENFADLLKDSYVNNDMLEPGQMIEAEIVKIDSEWLFLNLGGKSEGHLEAKELIDEEGSLTVKEGDTITAYFLTSQNGERLFTTRIGGNQAGTAILQKAHENAIPVEGFIEKEIKGGYEVKIGNSRAFCPYSQMGLKRTEDTDKYIGQHLSFRITEFSEKGRNIVLSNRAILEEERKAQIETLKESLQEGLKVKGAIKSLQDFGAFVDIGGIEALLPISEISRSRVDDINQSLAINQEIEAVIINLDWENERISLSIKKLQPDPWDEAHKKYQEGSLHTGKIARLMTFGAFVTLEPGLDGLIHISELGGSARIKHPRDVVSKGQTIEVQIASVDVKKKRISLKPVISAKEESEEDNYQQFTDKKNDSYKPLGNLGDLLKNKLDKRPEK